MMLPNTVIMILERLMAHGHEAFIVGGCVRDLLMGFVPKDWDITTDAAPEVIKYIFNNFKIIDIGARHGTIGVLIDGNVYEITTYRTEGEYIENRRPAHVKFIKDIREDLGRRDFTINAIAYNHKDGLIDLFGGIDDIRAGIIRCVGNPKERLKEDALRILRALRFSSEKGFEIEAKTYARACEYKALLNNISRERIYEELKKLLLGDNVGDTLKKYGEPIKTILPCLDSEEDIFDHLSMKFSHLEKFESRLALLFSACYLKDLNINKIYEDIVRLKFDNRTRDKVVKLVYGMSADIKCEKAFVKRLLRDYGNEIRDLLELREVYFEEDVDCFKTTIRQIEEEKLCFSLKQLAINGDDLIGIGIPKGKLIGVVLDKLLDEVIEETICNSKESLLVRARVIVNEED